MEIQPLKKENIFDAAVNAIGDYIISNRLQPGDPLPPEVELASKLQVSRNILREALRHFRTLGIIESKPKLGMTVRSLVPDNPYVGYFPFLAAQTDILPKLAEIRMSLETGAAEFMVRHASKEQIAHLHSICDRFEKAVSREERIRLETDFHITLLAAADNPLMTGLAPLLIRFFSEQQGAKKKGRSRPHITVVEEHRAMVEALKKKDSTALHELLYRHNIGNLEK